MYQPGFSVTFSPPANYVSLHPLTTSFSPTLDYISLCPLITSVDQRCLACFSPPPDYASLHPLTTSIEQHCLAYSSPPTDFSLTCFLHLFFSLLHPLTTSFSLLTHSLHFSFSSPSCYFFVFSPMAYLSSLASFISRPPISHSPLLPTSRLMLTKQTSRLMIDIHAHSQVNDLFSDTVCYLVKLMSEHTIFPIPNWEFSFIYFFKA